MSLKRDMDTLKLHLELLGPDDLKKVIEQYAQNAPHFRDFALSKTEHWAQQHKRETERQVILESETSFNKDYQDILDSISDDSILKEEESFVKLSSLARDFQNAALQYGKVIISEKYLPAHRKTIQPVTESLGGIAGGDKYIKAGILFKFAIDHKDVYGSDEAAAKEAGHQLKAVLALSSTQRIGKGNAHSLRFPLLVLIDYLGYRLLAMSLLPITKTTLLYGSHDGGKTIECSHKVKSIMGEIGRILKLKEHQVGPMVTHESGTESTVTLHMPCDIEVHEGHDGRFYCIDVARLLPPEPPNKNDKSAHLIRLLRPEFVRKYHTPLSSDAFSKFGWHNHSEHNNEVREAFQHLINKVIPAFGQWLDTQPNSVMDNSELVARMHEEGINVRHIGMVRHCVKDPYRREQLLIEVAARCIKAAIRKKLRDTMQQVRLASAEPYRVAVFEYLNLVFGHQAQSYQYRILTLVEALESRYPKSLDEQESTQKKCVFNNWKSLREINKVPEQDLYFPFQKRSSILALFERVQALSGIRISEDCLEEMKSTTTHHQFFRRAHPFERTDILNPVERIKEMPILQYAQGTSLLIRAKSKPIAEAKRLSLGAIKNFKAALAFNSSDYMTLCNYAFVLEDVMQDYVGAEQLYQRAILSNPSHVRSLYYYALFSIRRLGNAARAQEYFERALQCCPTHTNAMKDYAHLLAFQFQDYTRAEKYFRRAVECDPTHAKALMGLANFLNRFRKRPDIAAVYYYKACQGNDQELQPLLEFIYFMRSTNAETFPIPANLGGLLSPDISKKGHQHLSILYTLSKRVLKILHSFGSVEKDFDNSSKLQNQSIMEKACSALVEVAIDIHEAGYSKIATEIFQSVAHEKFPLGMVGYAKFLLRTPKNSNVEQADQLMSQATAISPLPQNCLTYALFLSKYKKDYEKADGYYRLAIENFPNDEEIQIAYLAFINNQFADNAETRRKERKLVLDWIAKIAPDSPLIKRQLGQQNSLNVSRAN